MAAALVVLAVAFRLLFLGERQLFRDEAASWVTAVYPIPELLARVAAEPYPPLYFLVLRAWTAVAGEGEAALRSLSVAAGLATVAVGWRWAHEALGRWAGLVALAVLVLSPLALANAREARMYALESAFATAGWWMTWRLLSGRASSDRARLAHGALLAVAVAVELWTLSIGVAVAGLQALVIVGVLLVARRRHASRRGPGAALAGVVAGGLTFLPWIPSTLTAAARDEPFWTATPGAMDWLLSYGSMLVGWRADLWVSRFSAAPLLLLAALGIMALLAGRSGIHGDRVLGWCLVAGAGLVLAVWAYSLVRSIYDHRYFGASVAPLALAVGAGALVAGRWLTSRPLARPRAPALRRLTPLVPLLTAGLLLPWSAVWVADWHAELDLQPARQLLGGIAARARPGDAILTVDARSWFPLAYGVPRSTDSTVRGMALYDWNDGDEPWYRGRNLLPDGVPLDAARVRGHWAEVVPALSRGGRLWLVTVAFNPGSDAYDDRPERFAPLRTGELVQDGASVMVPSNGPEIGVAIPLRLPGR